MIAPNLHSLRARSAVLVLGLALAGCQMGSYDPAQSPGQETIFGDAAPAAQAERLLRMAENAEASGDLPTAAALLDHAASRQPKNVAVLRSLGRVMQQLDRPQEAIDAYGAALAVDPDDPETAVGYAKAMIAIGRPEAAAAHIEPLLGKYPDDLAILNMAGVVFDMQAQHGRAIELYRRGLYFEPTSVLLQNNLGLSLALSGDAEGAIGVLEPLASGPDSSPRIRQNLALAYGIKGDVVAAQKLASLDLDSEAVANNLAYYSGLRSMAPSQIKSAALRPDVTAKPLGENRDLGVNVVVGVGLGGEELALGAAPMESWFLDLGQYGSAAAATAKWSSLQTRYADLTRGLAPLARGGKSIEPLLVGPLHTAEDADRLCGVLRNDAGSCRPVRL
ncbi:MAG: tetratricopeptide repeat protein [Geminicoccaceae bacterium]